MENRARKSIERESFLHTEKGKRSNKKNLLSNIITGFAIASLVFAFIYGKLFGQIDKSESLANSISDNEIVSLGNDAYLYDSDKYLMIAEENGYGGKLMLTPVISAHGIIDNILVLDHKETFSYYMRIKKDGFFKQYIGKSIEEPLILGQDIDQVSGATISSEAFNKAIRNASHELGMKYYEISYPKEEIKWNIGFKELMLMILFCLAIWAVYSGDKRVRYLALAVSLVFMGFYYNSALSISHFGNLLTGQMPDPHINLFIWLLLFGTIGFAFFTKKNVYCHSMCPFHTVEMILVKIGGFKIGFPKKYQKPIRKTAKVLLWASLMIIFLADNPTIAAYEPFAMIFGLEGVGIQWYILPAVLVGALFITDFFCRYFCPVGNSFKYVISFRKWIDSIAYKIRPIQLKRS